jgi:membrane protein insertase Oxa1/YidC/SpoIIIJ
MSLHSIDAEAFIFMIEFFLAEHSSVLIFLHSIEGNCGLSNIMLKVVVNCVVFMN